MAMIADRLIVGCWLVLLAYILISALSTKKTAERQGWANDLAYKLPFLLGALLLFWSLPWSVLHTILVPHALLIQVIAATLCVLGLLGALWARRTLAGNWSGEVVLKEDHELIERGPYRMARHPIYMSLILLVVGTALDDGRVAAFLGMLLIAVGLWVKLRQEEQLLLRRFPDAYAAYRSRVKALIPRVL